MSIKKVVLVGSSLSIAAAGIALPLTAANASIDLAARSGDTVQIAAQKIARVSPKNTIRLSGPKTGKLMKRINLQCTAPASLAGGNVILHQNGSILPQVRKFKVGSGGSCNFWIKSGISGPNTIDMAVKKSGKMYQSNAVKIIVS